MRADKLLMIGVVGIGVYAAYKLVTSKPTAPPPDAFGTPRPNPTNPADGRADISLPRTAGAPDPAPPALAVLPGPMLPLRGGAYYKARIEVVPAYTNAQIQADVAAAFGVDPATVEVFRFAADAAPASAIGQPWALVRPGQGTRWIRFRVSALGSGTRARPPWLVTIWQAATPTA